VAGIELKRQPASESSEISCRGRLERLRQTLSERRASSLLVTHPPNIFYICGFTGSAGVLLVHSSSATLFTDSRYALQAREEVRGVRVRITRGSLLSAAGDELRRRHGVRVAYSPGQLSVMQEKAIESASGPRMHWVESENAIEELRAVKDAGEIGIMRESARLISEVFEELLEFIRPGVLENDLAAEAEYRMRRKGASGAAFETIVASGVRGAWPHARPSSKPLGKNELVVLDAGAILRGYCSDMTRTVHLGRASQRIRRWYRAVVEAQEAARDAVCDGMRAEQVDAVARRVLGGFGLGRHFTHSTGHGLGLEVHEMPRLGRGQKTVLRAGNVITLEPGVYVEGVGGVRVEDDVLVLPRGAETLTTATRDFLEL
jgi:Xaa-Pro aminopeptidase